MKVKLTGINPSENILETQPWIEQLETISFPIECEVKDNLVNLTQYFINTSWFKQEQLWGLIWFDYEEIKD